MISLSRVEEFPGRFGVSYKDRNNIYAYDEITHGLYMFALNEKKISFLLSPTEIYKYTTERIQGISKCKNEIILIPQSADSEWIFYDPDNKNVRYFSPYKINVKVSSAVTVDNCLFLIPLDTDNSIIIFSLDDFKIVNKYDNWYTPSNSEKKDKSSVWGASVYNDYVIFPIVNTKYLFYLNNRERSFIALNTEIPILSVYMSKNEIWILPASGQFIFAANLEGEITRKINIFETEFRLLANEFNKLIVIEGKIFLLPVKGSIIYVFDSVKEKIIQIKSEEASIGQQKFIQDFPSYWGFIIENKTLHLLPSSYNYTSIDLDTFRSICYSLDYGDNIDENKYFKMVRYIYRNRIYYENQHGLFRFIQLLLDNNVNLTNSKCYSKIGKEIWGKTEEII